jgi:hypothetical protein
MASSPATTDLTAVHLVLLPIGLVPLSPARHASLAHRCALRGSAGAVNQEMARWPEVIGVGSVVHVVPCVLRHRQGLVLQLCHVPDAEGVATT